MTTTRIAIGAIDDPAFIGAIRPLDDQTLPTDVAGVSDSAWTTVKAYVLGGNLVKPLEHQVLTETLGTLTDINDINPLAGDSPDSNRATVESEIVAAIDNILP